MAGPQPRDILRLPRPWPHAQRTGVRLACGGRAPPRIWTCLSSLRVFLRPA